MQDGIKKIIKELDENGNEIEVEITEYPDIPVILVENNGEEIPVQEVEKSEEKIEEEAE